MTVVVDVTSGDATSWTFAVRECGPDGPVRHSWGTPCIPSRLIGTAERLGSHVQSDNRVKFIRAAEEFNTLAGDPLSRILDLLFARPTRRQRSLKPAPFVIFRVCSDAVLPWHLLGRHGLVLADLVPVGIVPRGSPPAAFEQGTLHVRSWMHNPPFPPDPPLNGGPLPDALLHLWLAHGSSTGIEDQAGTVQAPRDVLHEGLGVRPHDLIVLSSCSICRSTEQTACDWLDHVGRACRGILAPFVDFISVRSRLLAVRHDLASRIAAEGTGSPIRHFFRGGRVPSLQWRYVFTPLCAPNPSPAPQACTTGFLEWVGDQLGLDLHLPMLCLARPAQVDYLPGVLGRVLAGRMGFVLWLRVVAADPREVLHQAINELFPSETDAREMRSQHATTMPSDPAEFGRRLMSLIEFAEEALHFAFPAWDETHCIIEWRPPLTEFASAAFEAMRQACAANSSIRIVLLAGAGAPATLSLTALPPVNSLVELYMTERLAHINPQGSFAPLSATVTDMVQIAVQQGEDYPAELLQDAIEVAIATVAGARTGVVL